MDEGRRVGVVGRVPRVEIGDGGAERDLARRERQRLAESQAVAEARAIEPAEALVLEALGHLDGGLPPARDSDETHRRLAGHDHGTCPAQRFQEVVSAMGLRRLGPYLTAA